MHWALRNNDGQTYLSQLFDGPLRDQCCGLIDGLILRRKQRCRQLRIHPVETSDLSGGRIRSTTSARACALRCGRLLDCKSTKSAPDWCVAPPAVQQHSRGLRAREAVGDDFAFLGWLEAKFNESSGRGGTMVLRTCQWAHNVDDEW